MREPTKQEFRVAFFLVLAAFAAGFLIGFWQGNKTHRVELIRAPYIERSE